MAKSSYYRVCEPQSMRQHKTVRLTDRYTNRGRHDFIKGAFTSNLAFEQLKNLFCPLKINIEYKKNNKKKKSFFFSFFIHCLVFTS